MDKKKKIILAALAAGAAAFIFKDKLFPSASSSAGSKTGSNGSGYGSGPVTKYEGRVVEAKSANGYGTSKVINGYRIPFTTHEAWIADGRQPIYFLSDDEYEAIPLDWNFVISETGYGPRTVFV